MSAQPAAALIAIECLRCNGTKRLPMFRHIENGLCFACGGTGIMEIAEPKPTAAVPSRSKQVNLTPAQVDIILNAIHPHPVALGEVRCAIVRSDAGDYTLHIDPIDDPRCGPVILFSGRPGAWTISAVSDGLRPYLTPRAALALLAAIERK